MNYGDGDVFITSLTVDFGIRNFDLPIPVWAMSASLAAVP